MKRLSILVTLWAAVFASGVRAAEPTKLEVVTDDTKQVITGINWVDPTGKGRAVPAVSPDLFSLADAGLPTTQLKTSPELPYAVLLVTDFLLEKAPYGSALLLEPGVTTETIVDSINAVPVDVLMTPAGFYSLTIAGKDMIAAFTNVGNGKSGTTEVLKSFPYAEIKLGHTKLELTEHGVMVQTATSSVTLQPGGLKSDAGFVFKEFNAGAEDIVLGKFKGIDLVALARDGDLDTHYRDDVLLDRIVDNLFQKRSRNALLWSNQGVDTSVVVNYLAYQMAEDEKRPTAEKRYPELDGWRLISVNYAEFNAGGHVDVHVDKMRELLNVCRLKKIILYFPGIHSFKGLGAMSQSDKNDVMSVMIEDLSMGRVLAIGDTDSEGINVLRGTNKFISSFRQFEVTPPKGEALVNMLKHVASRVELDYNVVVSEDIVLQIIELTDRFIYQERQPLKSIRAIEDLGKAHAREQGETPYVATEKDLKVLLARITGIDSVAENKDTGLLKFLRPEVYKREINDRLVGHDNGKEALYKALINIVGGGYSEENGTGEVGVQVLLLTGPSGVGKSMLPQELVRILKKPEYNLNWNILTIEGEQFKDEASVRTLFGAPPGYVGYDPAGGKLYQFVANNPQGVIVIEEVDKMDRAVIDALYKFIEHGVVQDASVLKEAKFTRGLIVMTSNFGSNKESRLTTSGEGPTDARASELIDDYDRWHRFGVEPLLYPEVVGYDEAKLKQALLDQVEETGAVSPQVIGRIGHDNVVVLHHFNKEEIDTIGRKWLANAKVDYLRKYQLELEFTDRLYEWILERAWGGDGARAFDTGARSILNVIKSNVTSRLNSFMLLEAGDDEKRFVTWVVDVVDDKVVIEVRK